MDDAESGIIPVRMNGLILLMILVLQLGWHLRIKGKYANMFDRPEVKNVRSGNYKFFPGGSGTEEGELGSFPIPRG